MRLQHIFYFIAIGFVALCAFASRDAESKRTCLAIAAVFFIAGVIKGKEKNN
jgi:hypothetical protein